MTPVQFITHTVDGISYEQSALLALQAGCRWVQLRVKGAPDAEVEPLARRLLAACREGGAVLILDDRVELAKAIGADGVHLGKEDMPVPEARKLLGLDSEMLIGGTANTLEDCRRLATQGVDYIGLGPYRFTTTKQRLAPVLGLDGYRSVMSGLRAQGLTIPVVAIGGIELSDVCPLLQAGVDGIAVSGSVLRAPDPVQAMRGLLEADAGL